MPVLEIHVVGRSARARLLESGSSAVEKKIQIGPSKTHVLDIVRWMRLCDIRVREIESSSAHELEFVQGGCMLTPCILRLFVTLESPTIHAYYGAFLL